MPRGVYDRTKTKEQRASETKAPAKKTAKAAAAPQKRKYTKRATVDASPAKMSPPKSATASADVSFALMTEVRQNLTVLASLGDKFQDTPALQAEVSAHVELLGRLREKAFASDDSEIAQVEEVDDAPVATVSNGATAYQGTVPLPPPPSVPTVGGLPPIPTH